MTDNHNKSMQNENTSTEGENSDQTAGESSLDGAACSASSSRRLIGYGLFCGFYWGRADMKAWQLEGGIQPTREDANAVRTSHFLSRETRRIYNTTMINVGHHSSPIWKRADSILPHDQEEARRK